MEIPRSRTISTKFPSTNPSTIAQNEMLKILTSTYTPLIAITLVPEPAARSAACEGTNSARLIIPGYM
jgi:hypothetical protein